MTINERIKKRREELGLSATDVAKNLGVSRATLYRYEKADISKIPSDLLDKMGRIYNISLNELLGHEPKYKEDSFTYELLDEIKSLSEDSKKQILSMVKFLNSKEKKKYNKI